MIPPSGKLREVVNFPNGLVDVGFVKNGYFSFLWKDGEIVEGLILVVEGRIVGASVEYVISKRELLGDEALFEILSNVKRGAVKTVEVYTASPDAIRVFVDSVPGINCTPVELWGRKHVKNEKELLDCLRNHEGELVVHGNDSKWVIGVDGGEVLWVKQHLPGGSVQDEKEAVDSLIKAVSCLTGKFEVEKLPMALEKGNSQSSVGKLLVDALELLSIKKDIESSFFNPLSNPSGDCSGRVD